MPKYRILYEDINGLETTLAETDWLVIAGWRMTKAILAFPDAPRIEIKRGETSVLRQTLGVFNDEE